MSPEMSTSFGELVGQGSWTSLNPDKDLTSLAYIHAKSLCYGRVVAVWVRQQIVPAVI